MLDAQLGVISLAGAGGQAGLMRWHGVGGGVRSTWYLLDILRSTYMLW